MTPKETNKLIAEFMGLIPNKHDGGATFSKEIYTDENGIQWSEQWIYPDYHQNWNSLIEVVGKINAIDEEEFGVTIRGNITDIESCYGTYDMYIEERDGDMIENTYNACVRFIEWSKTATLRNIKL